MKLRVLSGLDQVVEVHANWTVWCLMMVKNWNGCLAQRKKRRRKRRYVIYYRYWMLILYLRLHDIHQNYWHLIRIRWWSAFFLTLSSPSFSLWNHLCRRKRSCLLLLLAAWWRWTALSGFGFCLAVLQLSSMVESSLRLPSSSAKSLL